MIATIQGLLIIIFFIIPGFTAVCVGNLISPARKGSTFDQTIQSIIYSTVVHFPAVFIITTILWIINANINDLNYAFSNYAGRMLFVVLCYFVVTIGISIGLGYLVSKNKNIWLKKILKENMTASQSTSVWDYIRTEVRPFTNKLPYAIHAKLIMKSGTIYFGDIVAMQSIIDDDKPYDMFIQKVEKVLKTGEIRKLKINGLLINSSNIEAIEIKFIKPEINK